MKILFINEPFIKDFCRTQRWPARTRGRALRPPDWLCYAAAVAKQSGIESYVCDFPANNWGKDRLPKLIQDISPDFIVLDSSTPSIYSDIECAGICKSASKAKVIMVGTHATACAEETITLSNGAIDVIALGEFDHTIRDIVCNWADLGSVAGICYVKNGKVEFSKPRALIDDLDLLPFPLWDQLNIRRYFDAGRLYPYIDIIGGRGCPYQCVFCQWPQLMFGNKYRFRSPGNIADEIEYDLKLFPLLKRGEFFFEDDTFTVNKERAYLICEEMGKRGLEVTWSINARPDIADLRLFKVMKKHGCRQFLVGFESGVQEILDNVRKGVKVEAMREFVATVKRSGIAVHGCFVLGLPGERRDTIRKTLDFALGLKLDSLQFSAAVPLPGTAYFNHCRSQGLLKSKSWSDWLDGGEQGAVVDYPHLTSSEIDSFVDEGLRSFYLRPQYMAGLLLRNRSVFDLYRKLRGGWNFFSYFFKR